MVENEHTRGRESIIEAETTPDPPDDPFSDPPDCFTRQKQLFALEDAGKINEMESIEKEFLKYKDPLGKMLEAYVSKNAEAFRPKGSPRWVAVI